MIVPKKEIERKKDRKKKEIKVTRRNCEEGNKVKK